MRLPTERQNKSKLVECEKEPKFKTRAYPGLAQHRMGHTERHCTLDQAERCPRLNLILTNNSYFYRKSQSFETGISDHHNLICTMLKSKYKQMTPKTITYRSCKNFTEEQFKEAIKSDCSYIECGNFSSTCN